MKTHTFGMIVIVFAMALSGCGGEEPKAGAGGHGDAARGHEGHDHSAHSAERAPATQPAGAGAAATQAAGGVAAGTEALVAEVEEKVEGTTEAIRNVVARATTELAEHKDTLASLKATAAALGNDKLSAVAGELGAMIEQTDKKLNELKTAIGGKGESLRAEMVGLLGMVKGLAEDGTRKAAQLKERMEEEARNKLMDADLDGGVGLPMEK